MNVQISKAGDVPAARAWEVVSDFPNAHRCHALVRSVTMRTSAARGDGAVRVCHFYDGTSVTEKIVRWDEDRSFSVKLSEFSMPLKQATASIVVSATGSETSEIKILMDFTPKFGLLALLMGKLVMRPMMTKMLNRVLAGMAHHARIGEEIGEAWKDSVTTADAIPAN
jgi:carbon monoxide dehydrogenase subunit G